MFYEGAWVPKTPPKGILLGSWYSFFLLDRFFVPESLEAVKLEWGFTWERGEFRTDWGWWGVKLDAK